MATDIRTEEFTKILFALLEETHHTVDGLYLDPGTSLKETLGAIDAEAASRPLVADGSTVAGHVNHAEFYLQVMMDYMQGKWYEKVDWKAAWATRTVTADEWEALKSKLFTALERVRELWSSFDDWNDERRLGGAMGIVAHTAFHLGAIRQFLTVVKGQ